MTDLIRAAGVLLMHDGKMLLVQRADGSGWALPGGKIEDGETAEQAAIRECMEETGFAPADVGEFARRIKGGVDFTTFGIVCNEMPDLTLCDEHSGYCWVTPDEAKGMALHPGMGAILTKLTGHELDVAKAIRDGELTSPQAFRNVWLFDMRITGTGAAYRSKGKEYVWRDPSLYLNDDFLARCNGLPVIYMHPPKNIMDSQEFAQRVCGGICLPYIRDNEVWGIAKIYDHDAAQIMTNKQMSTSPAVVLRPDDQKTVNLDDGSKMLIEGEPCLLDHLAICDVGVWDKAGDPRGIISEGVSMADDDMKTEDKKADESGVMEKLDSLFTGVNAKLDAMCTRMDAFEAGAKADAKEDKDEPEELAADAKKDSEDDDKEKEDKAKADADMSDVKTKIADLDERMPKELTDSEAEEMADAQSKADAAAHAFGERINTRPLNGEKPMAYRARMASKFKEHSPRFKDKDLGKMARADSDVFAMAEETIYADAMAAAGEPSGVPAGTLRAIRTMTDSGQRTEYRGKFSDAYGAFMAPPLRAHINKPVTIQ